MGILWPRAVWLNVQDKRISISTFGIEFVNRYGMIIFEVAHRTTISMFMATASITVLAHVNER